MELCYTVLSRDEIEKVAEIDRAEVIEEMYVLQDGRLEVKPVFYDVKGFHPNHLEDIRADLYELFDRGGTVFGVLDGERLVGIASLGTKWLGNQRDQLQMALLHVSHLYRKQGVATKLMDLVKEKARTLGAKKLYISATETKNTVDFYMGVGAVLASEVDPELFEREPEDIHLELVL